MRFTSEIHKTCINFLDLTISFGNEGNVTTEVYRKLTSTNGFLHWQSYHPKPLRSDIPIGQYLRARHNCSEETSFELECKELYNCFRAKGYPKKVLHRAYYRAKTTPRDDLLGPKPKS